METFSIAYKRIGKGFTEVNVLIKALNKTQAIKQLKDKMDFNISVKNVYKL